MSVRSKEKHLVRGAGILLAVSSLPSEYGIGTFGAQSFQFINFLKEAGQKYWQVLPIGPTSYGDSPYQSFSAFAGNPYFIDLGVLISESLLTLDEVQSYDWGDSASNVDYSKIFDSRYQVLHIAFKKSKHINTKEYKSFCKENVYWLNEYSLFMALKFHFENHSWFLWPEDIRFHRVEAVKSYSEQFENEIDFWKFCQFKFFEQWNEVKQYANENGIQIIGDIPIYAALDSADVWSNSELFQLDTQRKPIKVSGVPPDAFSKDGQLWGNPLYDWDKMEQNGFDWWKQRMGQSAKIYDIIRIDHFIGVVRYYAIPADESTAINGNWQPGPGHKLTDAIDSSIGKAQVIAEDLGVVVPEVRRLLKKTGYPGMKVLLFAFDGDATNEHLPCNYTRNMVVYGGTHDNETLMGHFTEMKTKDAQYAKEYLDVKKKKNLPETLLRTAYASVANTVMFQAQDILLLPKSARMNFPSTIGTNWRWRLKKDQLTIELAHRLNHLVHIYGR